MENNETDSGSRVTRSLRKRLASVDCDSSGRPETPISSKFTTIPEITASPSRLTRMTRRNSNSGIATPVKRVVASSAMGNSKTITPTKARPRRRSASINENEEFSQKSLKILTALDEESGLSDLKVTRGTRSQSKSPLLSNSCNTSPGAATPMKTPAKRGVVTSVVVDKNTAKKSYTQRHSMSPNENEEFSQKYLKNLTAIDKETEQCDLKPNRTTRSQSMSPLLNKSLHTSPGGATPMKTLGKRGVSTSPTKTYSQRQSISPNEKEDFSSKSLKVALDEEIVESDLKSSRVTRSQSKSPLLNYSLHTSSGSATLMTTSAMRGVRTSPTKTRTQRQRSSINEIEDFSPKNLKVLALLDKEIVESGRKSSTITRSLSKSPSLSHDRNSSSDIVTPMKKRKPGPKSKTRVDRELDEDFSDVEVSLFENEMEDRKNKQSNIATNVLSGDDPGYTKTKESKTEVKSDDLQLSHCPTFHEDKKTLNTVELQIEKNNYHTEQTNGNPTAIIGVVEELFYEKSNLEISGEEKNLNILDDNVQNKIVNVKGLPKKKYEYDEITSQENEISVSNIENSDYDDVNHAHLNDPPIPQTNSSFKQINDSSEVTYKSLDISVDKDNESVISGNNDIADAKMTPVHALKYSQSVEEDHSSTSINMECCKQEIKGHVLHEESRKTDIPVITTNILEGDNDLSQSQNGDELKWIIPSVKKKTSDDSKLDIVNTQYDKNLNNCCDNIVKIFEQGETNQIKNIFSSDDEEEDYYNEREDSNKPKNDLIDDEAMEVYDYISGDSMDSEERKEIENNEIPVDGESIGNQTTDDDQNESAEEKDGESDDSFIVSDNEELKFQESGDDIDIDENVNEHHGTNNKMKYKRIQRISDSSSTTDEEMEANKQISDNHNNSANKDTKSTDTKQKTERIGEDLKENVTKIMPSNGFLIEESRENIILDSSKLSDSALQLHCSDRSESGDENSSKEINLSGKETVHKMNQSDYLNKSIRNLNPENDASPGENSETAEMIGSENKYVKSFEKSFQRDGTMEQSEDHLGEISITSESDADKENEQNSMYLTIDRNTDRKLLEPEVISSSSAVVQGNDLANQDIRYLENSTGVSLPLGNPLIRTRRQSLALPTNPDMEICSSSHVEGIAKKMNRRSLGILPTNDFKPSQSFIDTIELQKSERNRFITKRKRLSKSFSGASETHDNSIVDVDVCHLNKRYKLMDESCIEDCNDFAENINSSKLFRKISSTPCEKTNKGCCNSERILTRCDEIIEAANRAKLEDKIRNRKSKPKISKKQLKNKYISTEAEEINPDDILRGISKEIKRRDKTKTALTNPIKAADDILSKKRNIHRIQKEQKKLDSKEVTEDMTEAIGKSIPIKKNSEKEIIHKQQKIEKVYTTATSAGIFMELPQSPERKKSTYIQLATGKVSVEPITPKKSLVKSFNGMKFRESPVTPNAVGFKVSKIAPLKKTVSASFTDVTRKRKRYNDSLRESHWTQSGLFTEEYITNNRGSVLQKTRNRQEEKKEHNVNCNFKEWSRMRPEIKRSTKREILLLKERRHARDKIKK